MSTSRRLVGLVAAALAVMAIGAAPALAEEEPAQFSPEGQGIIWSGTLTLENEGSATDCTTGLNYGFASSEEFMVSYYTGWTLYLSCEGGGQLEWLPYGYPGYDSGYKLGFEDMLSTNGWIPHDSPFGDFGGNSWLDPVWVDVPFVNGSESEPSTIVFDDTVIGHLDADESPITATGTLEVTTNSGGLLTLTK